MQPDSATPPTPPPAPMSTPTQPAPAATPPPVMAEKPKSKKGLWIIIGVVLLLVVGIGGIYLGSQLSPQPAPTPESMIDEPTPNPMADWKKYLGDNYELSYPPNFLVDPSNERYPIIYLQTKNPNECTGGGCNLPYRPLSIAIEANTNERTLSEISADTVTEIKIVSGNNTDVTVQNSTFLNSPSIIILQDQCIGYCKILLFKPSTNLLFKITENYANESEFNNYSKLADQILSTFKFTSTQATSTCDSGYKFFDDNYFSACFPSDMTSKSQEYQTTDVPSKTAESVTLENTNERIVITTSFAGGWGGGACSNEKTTISGLPANRLTFDSVGGSTCTDQIVNQIAAINGDGTRSGNLPIAIDDQQKGAEYLNRQQFDTILRSFKVK